MQRASGNLPNAGHLTRLSQMLNSGRGAFVGINVEEVKIDEGKGVAAIGAIVQIEGESYYTGASSTFIIKTADPIVKGFSVKDIENASQEAINKM